MTIDLTPLVQPAVGVSATALLAVALTFVAVTRRHHYTAIVTALLAVSVATGLTVFAAGESPGDANRGPLDFPQQPKWSSFRTPEKYREVVEVWARQASEVARLRQAAGVPQALPTESTEPVDSAASTAGRALWALSLSLLLATSGVLLVRLWLTSLPPG